MGTGVGVDEVVMEVGVDVDVVMRNRAFMVRSVINLSMSRMTL